MRKIIKFYNFVKDAITDPERDFSERVFLIFSIISEITVLIALAGDIYIGENPGEIITLIAILIIVPTTTVTCLYKNRVHLAVRVLVISLVFGVLPALFFFGGGTEGGGVLWIIFTFMYVGLLISGKWRNLLLIFLIIETSVFYLAEFYHPEWSWGHSRRMNYIDSYISMIMVGIVCFFMTWSQNRLYKGENERAKKEAERAEELTRSQNRFFSSMSHEIRTPINSILGLNELILRDQGASDEVVKDASGIQGAGKLLLSLINDILDFSKMEAGSMDIVPVDYHVGDMISEIVNMVWIKTHDKGLDFNVSIDPNVPSVLYGDEVRIKQVIINLLNNAVKYTAEGSVELHIEKGDSDGKTASLSISVTDTGMGIKKEALPYLFDAFKRVDEEKNRHIEGTGLGLSIVKQLVELMGGTVTVNSVYGEGSTFTVTLRQGITDPMAIGQLNIHNQTTTNRKQYEASFRAPDAKVLIVDDNEMNLEVEKKLIAGTQIEIDTVLSGKEALERTVTTRYDVILMDHVMPGMDGIECLEYIRSQTGGLNRTTPVVVLTANAGSENRELYHRSGFDGYLVKPVSGDAIEEILMRHIARDKLVISGRLMRMRGDINTAAGYARKAQVVITSTSMCDLPDNIIKKLNIPILPFLIRTENGVFKDGVQMDANELIRYINDGGTAISSPPDVKAYTEFFASALRKAHHLIHISISTSMSEDHKVASEAARSFDNVTVINSECLTSATGILVLIACKLAQQGIPVDEIISELETVKKRLRCSFVIDTTEFMAKKGLVSNRINRIAGSLSLHPSLAFRDDRSGIGNIWIGERKRAYRNYIRKAFPVDIIPDSDVVFITYADIPADTLLWIREEVSKIAYFEHVIFQQASAAISSNCGPGSFGILYFVKSNKSYNIGSFIDDEIGEEDEEAGESITRENAAADETDTNENTDNSAGNDDAAAADIKAPEDSVKDETGADMQIDQKWYQTLDFIDAETAIKNSGSEDAFRSVLRIFYDSIPDKTAELEELYTAKDWQGYTIKIHALKSSAKLIGAMELSEAAQRLETAGKEGNFEYIEANYGHFMEDYAALKDRLTEYFSADDKSLSENGEEKSAAIDKPVADE